MRLLNIFNKPDKTINKCECKLIHFCNNCGIAYKQNHTLILNKIQYENCPVCRPLLNEDEELKLWVLDNKQLVINLKTKSLINNKKGN